MGHLDLISIILKAGWFFGLSPSPIVVAIDGLAPVDRKSTRFYFIDLDPFRLRIVRTTTALRLDKLQGPHNINSCMETSLEFK